MDDRDKTADAHVAHVLLRFFGPVAVASIVIAVTAHYNRVSNVWWSGIARFLLPFAIGFGVFSVAISVAASLYLVRRRLSG